MLLKHVLVLIFTGFFTVGNAQLPGDLDLSYADEGIQILPVGSMNAFSQSMVIQSDGKAVIAIIASNGSDNDFTIIRLLPDGQPDPDFGTDGIVLTDFNGRSDSPQGIALDNESRIIVAGYVDNGNSFDFGVARYLPDGSSDDSFGDHGLVTSSVGITAFAESVAIQQDQKIIVAGYSLNPLTLKNEFTMIRYQENGTPDSTFHHDGIVMTDLGIGSSVANAVLIQDDGKILLAGHAFNDLDGTRVVVVNRYLENGDLDVSWHEDGIVFYVTPFNPQTITSMQLDGEGRVVVGGYNGTAPSNTLYTLARFQTNGFPDLSFTGDGLLMHHFGGQDNQINSLVIQPDGKILVGGSTKFGNEFSFVVARFEEGGSLDSTFGGDGIVLTEIGDIAGVKSIALQTDGKLLAAGESFDGNIFSVTVARFITGLSTQIEVGNEKFDFAIYPNPASERIQVQYELVESASLKFVLHDMTGRVIEVFTERSNKGMGSFQDALDLPRDIPDGMYQLTLTTEHGLLSKLVMVRR